MRRAPTLVITALLLAGLGATTAVHGQRPERSGNRSSVSERTAIEVPVPRGGDARFMARPERLGTFSVLADQNRDAAGAAPGNRSFIAINLEFTDPRACHRFAVPGTSVVSRHGAFADVLLQWGDDSTLGRVLTAPGVLCAEVGGMVEIPPPPPVSLPELTRAPPEPPEPIARGGVDGLTGRGVLVAILDTGVDFRSPDFVELDAQGRPMSRIVAMWDMNSDLYARSNRGFRPPALLPDGTPLGTVFDRGTLTDALRSGSKDIPATDLIGHGTACAGIAAGNGRSHADTRGVAPSVDLIVVRLCTGDCSLITGPLIGAACAWVDSVAAALKRPLVVSISFGNHLGPHDGSTLAERQLESRYPDSAPGRALCVSAGNEGQEPIHSRVRIGGPTDTATLDWEAPAGEVRIEIHLRKGSLDDLRLARLAATESADVGIRPVAVSSGCGERQPQIAFLAEGTDGTLRLSSRTGAPVEADVYLIGGTISGGVIDPANTVAKPGTSRGAITVGSYLWNESFDLDGAGLINLRKGCDDGRPEGIGQVSCFSSLGFSRDNTIKPDIIAPGEVFVASLARTLDGAPVGLKTDPRSGKPLNLAASGHGVLFRGTSAATPYVAGIIALMFEQNPYLTWGRIKALLRRNAVEDGYTGKVPDPRSGYGKLTLGAVKAMLSAGGSKPPSEEGK